MCYSETYIQIEKLFNKYGLEKLIKEPKQVTGGLMHKMYQIITKHKKYAVKELNPSVMQRNGVKEHIVNSERIAKALDKIVPVITAMQFNDNPLLMLDGQYYMIFEWVDGMSIFPPHISSENCIKMGTLLGKMHTANIIIPGMHKEKNETEIYEWDKYLLLGQEISAEWVHELSEMIDKLKKWNKEFNEACNLLSGYLVLSHRDLDPKNVMWKDNNPYIIDWESAGYVNPYQELLEMLNYWANKGNGELDKDKFDALYNAYITIAGSCQVNWEMVLASGFGGMLGWLNYSFKRSLGIESTSLEEKELGTEQVFGTMKALRQYAQNTVLVKNWLD
ncbi:phosphotransferase [Sedimentibacter sp. zth1]|uniref:phosphotransferase n=1 Tax=Sedimentibacter sp. zth1 TaxID=2816908 RepID=UPI001A91F491|nr:phosphotransferase [Sedimentibacter sp. zth1]QSX04751.1 phosphotransferase [Sedimentibacter sp. zth1]